MSRVPSPRPRAPHRALVIALLTGLCALAAAGMTPTRARAFCGFYVAGADSSLYSDASMVVLMREGQRTVLSMQNAYSGPPSDFAMVVPVPEVLHEEDVRTLPREIFQKVDRLSAPRLVEYWEEDPCRPQYDYALTEAMPTSAAVADGEAGGGGYQVRVEARFSVAEYDVVVLSAGDSNGLERWLHDEGYNIPAGAARVLRPYVEGGTKFFVAKVDVQRVQFDANGRAVLSPLRFHFDDPHFQLPVRLGLLNSQGEQDLIVHTLGLGTRYEVANYPNATIPTNIVVDQQVREHFGPFYERLIEETLQQHPGAVLTEYAWSASSCDPCPGPTLDGSDIMTLGGDVIPSGAGGDSLLMTFGQTTRRSRTWWRNVLDEFEAGDVLVPIARLTYQYPGGPVKGEFTARYGPDNSYLDSFTLEAANPGELPKMLNQAVRKFDGIFEAALAGGKLKPDSTLSVGLSGTDPALQRLIEIGRAVEARENAARAGRRRAA